MTPELRPAVEGPVAARSLAGVDQVVHVRLYVVEGMALVFEGPVAVLVITMPQLRPHRQHPGKTTANGGISSSDLDLVRHLAFNC